MNKKDNPTYTGYKNPKLKDIKYGLIVIDPEENPKSDHYNILHFCGYWEEPTQQDVDNLREELRTTEEFGLTDIAHRIEILPCPDYLVYEYMKDVPEDTDETNVWGEGLNAKL